MTEACREQADFERKAGNGAGLLTLTKKNEEQRRLWGCSSRCVHTVGAPTAPTVTRSFAVA